MYIRGVNMKSTWSLSTSEVYTLQHTAEHCNTLQHTAPQTASLCTTHCNTLQHTLQYTLQQKRGQGASSLSTWSNAAHVIAHVITSAMASCDTGWQKLIGSPSCRSFSTKEPLNIGHFCGKWPIKIRDPMSLRHPVAHVMSYTYTSVCHRMSDIPMYTTCE